jgi:hypothetical protein
VNFTFTEKVLLLEQDMDITILNLVIINLLQDLQQKSAIAFVFMRSYFYIKHR